MGGVQLVRLGDQLFVKHLMADSSLIAAYEKDRVLERVESKRDSQNSGGGLARSSFMFEYADPLSVSA